MAVASKLKHVSRLGRRGKSIGYPKWALVAASSAVLLCVAALTNRRLAAQAEQRNPRAGGFLDIDGVRLHYIERGQGKALVLLHGNGSMIQDFTTSGLVDLAASTYRVIVFDRPGYGYSTRPIGKIWDAAAQADLIHAALVKLGASPAIVLGHSWGASVAAALGLRHPNTASALVLASGYYYPTARGGFIAMSVPAIPVIGDIMRHTVSPILARLMFPTVLRKLFGPAAVPVKFSGFSEEMAVRPSQIKASAEEAALALSNAMAMHDQYGTLEMPVVIIAGEEDRLIDVNAHSARLHAAIAHSSFRAVPGAGHMVHQTATSVIMAAIEEADAAVEVGRSERGAA